MNTHWTDLNTWLNVECMHSVFIWNGIVIQSCWIHSLHSLELVSELIWNVYLNFFYFFFIALIDFNIYTCLNAWGKACVQMSSIVISWVCSLIFAHWNYSAESRPCAMCISLHVFFTIFFFIISDFECVNKIEVVQLQKINWALSKARITYIQYLRWFIQLRLGKPNHVFGSCVKRKENQLKLQFENPNSWNNLTVISFCLRSSSVLIIISTLNWYDVLPTGATLSSRFHGFAKVNLEFWLDITRIKFDVSKFMY